MEKAHALIKRIADFQGRPFAIWELCQDCKASRTYVRRVMGVLTRLGLTRRLSTGMSFRVWSVTPRWPASPTEVVDNFETMYRFMIQDERLRREKKRLKALKATIHARP